jgi:hypothetical protein
MPPRRLLFAGLGLALAAVVALAAYALRNEQDEGPSSATSGLRGVVVLGRCLHGADKLPCSFEPMAATQVVRRYSDDRVITEFQSAADGSFRVALSPGRYIFEGSRGQDVGGFLRPTYISVPAKRFGYERLIYETP